MIVCRQCGRENDENFNFCLGCGSNLDAQPTAMPSDPDQIICPNCQEGIPPGHLFCGTCGERLSRKTSEAKIPPPYTHSGEDGSAAESQVKIVLINPDGSMGKSIHLKEGDNIFGRESGARVFRDDPFLSPEHVNFFVDGESVDVRDLSLNGVFVRIVGPVELRHGDHIRMGRQLFLFENQSQATPIIRSDEERPKVLGAPSEQVWGRLSRVSSPELHTEAFVLTETEEVIGRERGSIMVKDDGFVSSRHARLSLAAGSCYLDDLRSSNGTFLRVRERHTLKNGDLLIVGQQPLRLLTET